VGPGQRTDRLALHVRRGGPEPIPPSAGLGHRLLAREFAGHQDTILKKIGLETDLRDR
jgi:hypothetical protein